MLKTVWISYDLGVKGDYPGFYAWLDSHEAKECGDNLAVFKYDVMPGEALPDKLKADLEANVAFGKANRVYLIWKSEEGNKGRFLVGNRRAAPWVGFGSVTTEDDL